MPKCDVTVLITEQSSLLPLYVFTGIHSNSDGVLCFDYSCMRIVNDMYHIWTFVQTPDCCDPSRSASTRVTMPMRDSTTYASSIMSRHSGAETKSSQCTKIKYQWCSLMPYLNPFTIVSDQSWSRYACCRRYSMPLLGFTPHCFHAKLNSHPTVFHALFYGLVWKQIVPFAFGYLFVVLQ